MRQHLRALVSAAVLPNKRILSRIRQAFCPSNRWVGMFFKGNLMPPSSADHSEIAALVYRYARFVRQGFGAACGDLFVNDASYEIFEADGDDASAPRRLRTKLEGRTQIGGYISASTQRGIRLCPLIHNLIIDRDGDSATANSVLEGRTWPAGHETIGEYEDCIVRVQGRWLFASRSFTMFVTRDEAHDA
jgi:hypothetical protein